MCEKIYACLLRLYPSAFRTKYQEEALLLYRDRFRNETGIFQRGRLYCDLILDFLVTLPQAWSDTYAAASTPSLIVTPEHIPSFRLLEEHPLRPALILVGGTVSFAALSTFCLIMGLPASSRSYSMRHRTSPMQSLTKYMNRTIPGANRNQPTATNTSAEPGVANGQFSAGNTSAVSADSGERIDRAERERVIRAVAGIIAAHYVDPQKGHVASDLLLTREKLGAYDVIDDGPTLAERLSQDIQSSTKDPHLLVHYNSRAMSNSPPPPTVAQREEYHAAMLRQNCTVQKVQVLSHNIGYIKFNFFPDPAVCSTTFHSSIEQLNQSSAIIFDLRDNRGGMPEMVARVAAELFDRPVLWYNPRATPNASVLSPAKDSKLAHKPVYILTSSNTFSGAEHFTYDLKMLKRATVVGEVTRGGHVGVIHRIDDHFLMVVPEARKPSPYGTLDWEGTGVEPNVKVSSADALKVAEKLAERRLRLR